VALNPTKKNQIWSHYRFEVLTVLQVLRKLQTVKVIHAGMKMSKSMLDNDDENYGLELPFGCC
jgi:hypothetical protein